MGHQWKVGDLARCIRDAGSGSGRQASTPIVRGRIYRVLSVHISAQGPVGLMVNQTDDADWGCWNASWFRPILPAKTAFIEQMRALKPRVEA